MKSIGEWGGWGRGKRKRRPAAEPQAHRKANSRRAPLQSSPPRRTFSAAKAATDVESCCRAVLSDAGSGGGGPLSITIPLRVLKRASTRSKRSCTRVMEEGAVLAAIRR